jgi:hypothetical protein
MCLRRLSRYRHLLFKVDFNRSPETDVDQDYAEPEDARVVVDDPEIANTISSRLHPDDEAKQRRFVRGGWHTLALDVDHPVTVVPSTTEGHFHLYIDVPMPWDDYCRLMIAMSDAGIVEPGYVDASIDRGASFLRLPGVKKETES